MPPEWKSYLEWERGAIRLLAMYRSYVDLHDYSDAADWGDAQWWADFSQWIEDPHAY